MVPKCIQNPLRMALGADGQQLERGSGDIAQSKSRDPGRPGKQKKTFYMRGVQNQTLSYMDDDIVLR